MSHHSQQTRSLCPKPRESSPNAPPTQRFSWCCPLCKAVKWAGISLYPLLYANIWEPLLVLACDQTHTECQHSKMNHSATGFNLVFFNIQYSSGYNVLHKDMTAKASFPKKNTIMTSLRVLFFNRLSQIWSNHGRLLKIWHSRHLNIFSRIHVWIGKLPLQCSLLSVCVSAGLFHILTLQPLSSQILHFFFFLYQAGTVQLLVK